jgi:hypothetical protein
LERELVAQLGRPPAGIGPEEIGLSLEEGKTVLREVQARIVQTQVDALGAAPMQCGICRQNQHVKDLRTRCVRTVFGSVQVSCRLSEGSPVGSWRGSDGAYKVLSKYSRRPKSSFFGDALDG